MFLGPGPTHTKRPTEPLSAPTSAPALEGARLTARRMHPSARRLMAGAARADVVTRPRHHRRTRHLPHIGSVCDPIRPPRSGLSEKADPQLSTTSCGHVESAGFRRARPAGGRIAECRMALRGFRRRGGPRVSRLRSRRAASVATRCICAVAACGECHAAMRSNAKEPRWRGALCSFELALRELRNSKSTDFEINPAWPEPLRYAT